ncbi:MAG: DUF1367 family protein [Gelidibacter sp.]|nr:DUF1367 family protein [Gelidibacter sp.]
MEVYLIKTLSGHLAPMTDDDRQNLKSIKVGDEIKCKISRPRNIGHHRKFFAFLNLVVENMPESLEDRFSSTSDLLDELKMQLGYREMRTSLTGKEYYKPKSISFAKMDQSEFEKFYNDSIDLVCTHILPGVEKQEIIEHLVAF